MSCSTHNKNNLSEHTKVNKKLESSSVANVFLNKDDSHSIKFKKEGEIKIHLQENNKDHFIIYLDNSIINFKYPYKFIIANYQNRNDLVITLNKINNTEFYIEILQNTKKTVYDKIYFHKANLGKYEIYKMELIEPYIDDLIICEYPTWIYHLDIVNLYYDELEGKMNCKTVTNPDRNY